MTRARSLLLTLWVLTCSACGPAPEVVPAPAELEEAGRQAGLAGRWSDAARRYGEAFALEDPVEERGSVRARLAFRRGAALARAGNAEGALSWLRQALRLDPARRDAWFEMGRLHDGEHPTTVDHAAARRAYEAFLAAYEDAGAPEQEQPLVRHAQERLSRLPAARDE